MPVPYGLPSFNDDPGQIRPGVVVMSAGSRRVLVTYETLGDLGLPTAWLSEIFVNLALRAVVVTRLPDRLPILETMPTLAAGSAELTDRVRRTGFSTLDELETNYTGGERPMSPSNYVWYQNRWHRLAAAMLATDGEPGVRRFWDAFHCSDRFLGPARSAAALAPRLGSEVSATLGAAVTSWDRTPAM